MKYLKSYDKLFESNFDIDDIKVAMEEDGFKIFEANPLDFLNQKYKTFYNNRERSKELKKIRESDCISFGVSPDNRYRESSSFGFNLYDVEPHIKRLIDYAVKSGYSYEIRKILEMSRKSIDVTNTFNRKVRDSKRNIIYLQILFCK